ncbi:MAG: hypothetical protein IT438_08710 [Phycisphaerales bacterium]|nr:hypothetical protein [Phycisphaerales bacterium]
MKSSLTSIRASMVAAALAFGAGLAACPAVTSAAPAMCPPSEGDFDFQDVDISGDGMVMLPETVRITAVASTSRTDADGKIVVDKRVTLVVRDPARPERPVMAMRLTPTAAEEVREWLASAVTAQEKFIAESKATEKPGIECTLDAKRCREMTVGQGSTAKPAAPVKSSNGVEKLCVTEPKARATIPAMWVTVTSQGGARHGWSTMTEPAPAPGGCRSGLKEAANVAAAPADNRISLTTYERSDGGRPLTVRMDCPTAKKLLADLGNAIDERNGKAPVAPAPAESTTKTGSAS